MGIPHVPGRKLMRSCLVGMMRVDLIGFEGYGKSSQLCTREPIIHDIMFCFQLGF